MRFSFELMHRATDCEARCGRLHTAHGTVHTPVFMPVGTRGAVKAILPRDLQDLGAEIILGNTFHLYLKPGAPLIEAAGGLQQFTGWGGPVLTDSGGYQLFSLSQLVSLSDEGFDFRSPIDGSSHFLSPEAVIDLQIALGSDIAMVLDECPPYPCSLEALETAVNRTSHWAERSLNRWFENEGHTHGNALFGIVQGGVNIELRKKSIEELVSLDFNGYALGGLSVGEPKDELDNVLHHSVSLLPAHKPRYLMGVGTPEDILNAITHGIDMFDCVLPTRHARNGSLFTSRGLLNIRNARWADYLAPLDPECECYCCQNFSAAYLRHLFKIREIGALQLNTIHNVSFYLALMKRARKAIKENNFPEFKHQFLQKYYEASY